MSSESRLRIVSGGQTGADRGALDAAISCGVPCGGWCPADRMAEDGPIPDTYPLQPLLGAGSRQRTRKNVLDSDGTVIISFGPPTGGTWSTLEDCIAYRKPHLLIDASKVSADAAAAMVADFARSDSLAVLNVAGPRASEQPGIHAFVFDVVRTAILIVFGTRQ